MCWCWRGGTKVTRKWEVFAGRNRFWCDGRVMTAPQPGVFLLTLTLITVTCAVHFAFDCVYLAARVSPAVPAAGVALTIITVASLLRTALTDPGIIPRASPSEAAVTDASPTQRPPPRTREVLIRGRPVKLKYCFTCKMFRPPRASHCSLCDNCVDRFDHHCPWVGNCVGRRNYRFFYTFVVSLSFLCVWVFSCGVAALVLEARGGGGVGAALRARPPSALVAAVAFLAVWSVLGLAGFHTYLASTDQTTNEDIKGSFSSSRNGASNPNPYSRGNACANCWHVLCGPLAPSLIDRRGVVTVSDNIPVVVEPPTHNGFGGSYTNLYESGDIPGRGNENGTIGNITQVTNGAMLQGTNNATHAYMNHTLELDSLPPQEPPTLLSASRLRLLHDTTMIDAALDLDDPLHYAPNPAVTHNNTVTHNPSATHYGPPVPHTIVRLPP